MSSICFELVDAPVIHGRAGELALGTEMTYARLLEHSAAVAGAMLHLGVVEGDEIGVELGGSRRVVAVLAVARLGARPVEEASTRFADGDDGPVFHHGDRVLDWELMRKAGASEPASCVAHDPPGVADAVRTFLPH